MHFYRCWKQTVFFSFLMGCGCVFAAEFHADFNGGRRDGWFIGRGECRVEDGTLHLTGPGSLGKGANFMESQMLTRLQVRSGTITMKVMPITGPKVWRQAGSDFNHTCDVGIILKLVNGKPQPAVVLSSNKVWLEKDEAKTSIGPCNIKPNAWHEVKVQFDTQSVSVAVDGKSVGTIPVSLHVEPGWFGLLNRGDAKYDDIFVSGDFVNTSAPSPRGESKLTIEFSEWRPERFFPETDSGSCGSLYVYVRNNGTGSAILKNVVFAGSTLTAKKTPPWTVYLRQQPYQIEPGELGQIEIRFRSRPPQLKLNMDLTVRPQTGSAVSAKVSFQKSPPAQINFIGFGEKLTKLYVYLQNNERVLDGKSTIYHPTGVQVNGHDVLTQVQWGSDVVAGDVTPLEIKLSEPLVQTRPTVVTVTFKEGFSIGHCLRAFHSQFEISMHGSHLTRYDEPFVAQDLYRHGITTTCALPRARQHGITEYRMMGNQLSSYLPWEKKPFSFIWHDEVDKPWGNPLEKFRSVFDEWLDWSHAVGRELSNPISWNYVSITQNAVPGGYINYADFSKHSYGLFSCARLHEPTFARRAGLHKNEYRLGRRPWHPYFRDCEIFIPVDNATKQSLYPLEVYQRCLTPKEIRWVQYGTLLMGAKSFSHWAYWANKPDYGFWFDKTFNAIPTIRAGYGGLQRRSEVWGFKIDPYYQNILQNVWDEVGRISAEVQAVGPLLATADVTYAAKVIDCDPAKGWGGGPAVEAASLQSGIDTMVLLVLNMRYDPGEPRVRNYFAVSVPGVPNFPETYAKVAVQLPENLKANHVFRIRSDGLTDLKPTKSLYHTLVFDFPKLIVSDLVVITSRKDVRDRCGEKINEMWNRLRAGHIDSTPTQFDPVCPLPKLPKYQDLKKEKS